MFIVSVRADLSMKFEQKLLLSRIKQALRLFDAVKIETPNLPSHREKKSEVKVVGYSSIMNIPFPNYAIFDGKKV